MKILYIDCFFGFDAAMLHGALIDEIGRAHV